MGIELEELLTVLACPATREPLTLHNGMLVNAGGSTQYDIVEGIPDLKCAPERLQFDMPWYEPWQDLDELSIRFPEPVTEDGLPYHLDRHLAAVVPACTGTDWLLEIGCGERQAERWFTDRGFKYLGVDVDRRGPGPNVFADGHNLPVQNDSMACCASMAVMEHLVSPLTFAREVFRVLQPGGTFVGSAAFMYGFHDRASFHHMSHAGLLYVLRAAGFTVEQVWPDWRYQDSIPSWSFRGMAGLPWRALTTLSLKSAEWTFTTVSNIARKLAGRPPMDTAFRDICMAGSISFVATKPT